MLERLIGWSLAHRGLVLTLTLLVAGAGALSFARLPFDAFPDTTPVQVQVNTNSPALSPLEVERQLTLPVEQALAGLKGLTELRSVSKFGFSQVTLVFDDSLSVYLARQQVAERLAGVELPAGTAAPTMGPVTTGLGEVFHYLVSGQGKTLAELRAVQDWVIAPQLRSVPGVAEVNSWGGEERQVHVVLDPREALARGLTLADVVEALERSNVNVGGGVLVRAGNASLVRGVARLSSFSEVGRVVIAAHDGVPVRVEDIATVREGAEIRRGAVTAEGNGEAVLGLGFMLMGENSHEVSRNLRSRLDQIRPSLPEGVEVTVVYERTELVNHVLSTVRHNLTVGAVLVVAILLLFLGSFRAGLIVASVIPLSLLMAGNVMAGLGIAGSLMSLGALDFGLVVDSSVIVVENAVRRLSLEKGARSVLEIVRDAAVEVRRPTLFGELIILIVYLPVLALEGVEGRLFRPMALTVMAVLGASMVLSLTAIPALASVAIGRRGGQESEPTFVRAAKLVYLPVLGWALRHRRVVLVAAVVAVTLGGFATTRLGGEFVPRLSEESVVINTIRLASVSLPESIRYGSAIERVLRSSFPDEIAHVWTRTGTAEVATDPMGLELSDVFVTLKPRKDWTRARSQDELVTAMRGRLSDMPGMRMVFTQPIEMRLNETVAGARSDVVVKLFGDDLEVLKTKAAEIHTQLLLVEGEADSSVEQITGQPVLEVTVDREALARHGVHAADAMNLVQALGPSQVGDVLVGERRVPLAVTISDEYRAHPDLVATLPVPAGNEAGSVPLGQLATIRTVEGPSTIQREWGKRRILVQSNVRGRDVESWVEEARRRVEAEVSLPSGYFVRWGGQFEQLQRARTRLAVVVPVSLFLVFLLLYVTYGRVLDALRVFTGVPFAAMGGVLALLVSGMPFSVSAGVGFVALCGVSVLADMVLVSTIRQHLALGMGTVDAVRAAAEQRLRPVLITGIVAALGFVPMALSRGVGAEVQRPLATVVIGGLFSSTLLTLLVLPVLYTFLASGRRPESPAPPPPIAIGTTLMLAVLVFSSTVHASESTPERLTLEQAQEIGLARSPLLRAKRAELEQAEGRLRTAKTYPFNPELSIDVGRRVSPAATVTDRAAWMEQEIEIGGQGSLRATQAEADVEAIRSEVRREEQRFLARLRGAFVEALRARELLKLEQANTELSRSLVEASRKRFDAGDATQVELNLATGQAGRAERSMLIAKSAYQIARAILAEVVSLDPAQPPEPEGELSLPSRDLPALSDLLSSASANRPDLEAFRRFTESSQARIDLARRQAVPNLVFGVGYAHEEGDNRIVSARIGVQIPLFNRKRGAIAEGEGALHEARAKEDASVNQMRQEVASAFYRYQAGAQAASRFQAQVLSTLQDNFHLLQRSFDAGKIGWTEVLVFRREFVEIQREFIETVTDAVIAGIELDLAAGSPMLGPSQAEIGSRSPGRLLGGSAVPDGSIR